MALSPEIEAQILRYYHAERWRIGTIATQLHVHRDSVARVLAQAGLPAWYLKHRPSPRRIRSSANARRPGSERRRQC